jgi:hypothetical protein
MGEVNQKAVDALAKKLQDNTITPGTIFQNLSQNSRNEKDKKDKEYSLEDGDKEDEEYSLEDGLYSIHQVYGKDVESLKVEEKDGVVEFTSPNSDLNTALTSHFRLPIERAQVLVEFIKHPGGDLSSDIIGGLMASTTSTSTQEPDIGSQSPVQAKVIETRRNTGKSLEVLLNQLRENRLTFYELILSDKHGKQSEDKLKLALYAMREYFSADVRNSLKAKKRKDKTLEFTSKSDYLNHILTIFFCNIPNNPTLTNSNKLLKALLEFIKDPKKDLTDDTVTNLNKAFADLSITDMERLDNLKYQIIESRDYTVQSLENFLPDQDAETVIRHGFEFASEPEYSLDYLLYEDEVKYLSWTLTALFTKQLERKLYSIPGSYAILNVSFQAQSLGNKEDYLSLNMDKALEALYTTAYLKAPAYFICSNGGHWATVALIPIDGELHILKFDSNAHNHNNTTMVDGFAVQLSSFFESTKLFNKIHNIQDLSQPVQCSMNCGVASGAFISVLNSLLGETPRPIDNVIQDFPKQYAKLGINPKDKANTTKELVKRSLHYGIGLLSAIRVEKKNQTETHQTVTTKPIPVFNYDRNRLFLGLDLGGQRKHLVNLFDVSYSTPKTQEQENSTFLYMCFTILTLPLTAIIAFCNWMVFNTYCAISEKPLETAASNYCNTFKREFGKDLDKNFLSEDLCTLVG